MEILKQIKDWSKELLGILGILFGISIFAELLFGSFMGGYSVITHVVDVVSKFGNAGFVGLIAMLVIIHFANKS